MQKIIISPISEVSFGSKILYKELQFKDLRPDPKLKFDYSVCHEFKKYF